MRLLVAGLTGQLGTAVRELAAAPRAGGAAVRGPAAADAEGAAPRLVALRRQGSPRGLPTGEVDAVVSGDVRQPLWGLAADALDGPVAGVDAVVNLAADTNWAGGVRNLFATNALGAVHGYQLARELGRRAGRPVPYVYAGSVYVAGGAVGEIPERPAPPAGDRTAYERSKWLAEQQLISAAGDQPAEPAAPGSGQRPADRPPLLIARLPALVGDSRTGRTVRRNSLYLLADRWTDLPGGLLPAMRDARVDVLPRDLAAAVLVRVVRAVLARPPAQPLICHLGLGETAPSLRSVLAAARTAGGQRSRGEPRLVTVGARALLWGSLNADRFLPLSQSAHNALIGLRYLGLDRVFSRPVLAGLLGSDLPAVDIDVLARLIFDARPRQLDSPVVNGSMARFPG